LCAFLITAMSTELPPNWETRFDATTNRTYYVNIQTLESRWEKPTMPSSTPPSYSSSQPLPPNWEERVDPASGNVYYVNIVTRESRWDRPEGETTVPQASPILSSSSSLPSTSTSISTSTSPATSTVTTTESQPLPDKWEERFDPSTQKNLLCEYCHTKDSMGTSYFCCCFS